MIESILKSAESFLKNGVKSILGMFFSEKLPEKDKKKMELEITKLIQQFQSTYFGAYKDLTTWGKDLRASVRPMVTYIFLGLMLIYGLIFGTLAAFGVVTMEQIEIMTEVWKTIPKEIYDTFFWIMLFWFGSSGVQGIIKAKNGGGLVE